MEYLVISFRSRAETVKFSEYLRGVGIRNEIINTPKEAGVGCGLSVKTATENFLAVKKAISSAPKTSFAGFFLVTVTSGKRIVKTI